MQEHLRRQIVLIGDSYKDYAASCANSLEGVALAMRAAEHNAKAEASDAASGGVMCPAARAFKGGMSQVIHRTWHPRANQTLG